MGICRRRQRERGAGCKINTGTKLGTESDRVNNSKMVHLKAEAMFQNRNGARW